MIPRIGGTVRSRFGDRAPHDGSLRHAYLGTIETERTEEGVLRSVSLAHIGEHGHMHTPRSRTPLKLPPPSATMKRGPKVQIHVQTVNRLPGHISNQYTSPRGIARMAAEQQDNGKGKGRAQDQDQQREPDRSAKQSQEGEDQSSKQEMKEVRRPPPLPIVKGTIGAIGKSTDLMMTSPDENIESPSRRSFYGGSPASSTTVRSLPLVPPTPYSRLSMSGKRLS